MLVRLENISKSYADRVVLAGVSLALHAGERIALVGPNGSGKTTLLSILSGRLEPDDGNVFRSRDLSLALVEQRELALDEEAAHQTVLESALTVFDHLQQIEHRLMDHQHTMASDPAALDEIGAEYAELQERFKLEGGFSFRSRTEAVLAGLGLGRDLLHHPCGQLSGGQQSRLKLARALLEQPDLLLLDEPTNHLDLEATEWLEGFLTAYSKAFLVISHDRYFLDQVTRTTLELRQGKLYRYSGSYSFFVKERSAQIEQQQGLFERQQGEIERTEDFIRRNLAGQKTKQAQSRRKRLEKLERITAPEHSDSLRLRIREAPSSPHQVASLQNLRAGYAGCVLIDGLDLTIYRGNRFGIIGRNGSGKTTLLRVLLGELAPLRGKIYRTDGVLWGAYSQTQQDLNAGKTILSELHDLAPASQEGALRGYLANFLFRGDDIYKRIESLSGGEKSRVALAKLFLRSYHVLVLDEPTNHLDIPSREVLEEALADFGGTIFVVSHDRYFLKKIGTQILRLEEGRAEFYTDIEAFESQRRRQQLQQTEQQRDDYKSQKAVARVKSGLSNNERRRLEQQATEAEQAVRRFEAERNEINEQLQTGDGADYERLHRLAERFEELDAEISTLYVVWEKLMQQLE